MRSKLKVALKMLQRDPQNGVFKEEQNKACENMKGFEETHRVKCGGGAKPIHKKCRKNILRHVKSMCIQPTMKGELLVALEGFVKKKVPCRDKVYLYNILGWCCPVVVVLLGGIYIYI
jgi:hypothetical protein